MRQGNRFVGRFLCLDYRLSSDLKFGLSVSRRYGSSPERNRFKRLVREAFLHCQTIFSQPFECNIFPRQKAKEAKLQDIQTDLLCLSKQLGSHAQ